MVSLRLENDFDSMDMTEVETDDYGVQVIAGATGFGLPPVDLLWSEGAGDGARYRGRRLLPRPMDIPIYLRARNRNELKGHASRVAQMFADRCRLVFVEDDFDDEWYVDCAREGGGDWTFGQDTNGETEARTIVTLKGGDPYWTSTKAQKFTISTQAKTGLLTGSLTKLKLASGQNFGSVDVSNSGDAEAYPVWTITGPGTNFIATSPSGETLRWTGTLLAGRTLTIDSRAGTVVDDLGVNRYMELAPRPRFWTIPKGSSTVSVSLDGTQPNASSVTCTWHARRWVSI